MVTVLDCLTLDCIFIESVVLLKVLQFSLGKVLAFYIISDIVGTDKDSSPEIIEFDSLGWLNVFRG